MCMGSELRCGWLQSYYVVAILSMADMFCLECRNCGVHELGLYRVYKLCEILLLLNMADMDCLLCRRLWSEQC